MGRRFLFNLDGGYPTQAAAREPAEGSAQVARLRNTQRTKVAAPPTKKPRTGRGKERSNSVYWAAMLLDSHIVAVKPVAIESGYFKLVISRLQSFQEVLSDGTILDNDFCITAGTHQAIANFVTAYFVNG